MMHKIEKVVNKMNKVMHSKYYLLFIIFIAMPLNGIIIASNPLFGIILIAMQFPIFLDYFESKESHEESL